MAAAVSSDNGNDDFVPFFVGLTIAGLVVALLVRPPFTGERRGAAKVVALAWLGAAVWALLLLAWATAMCSCSYPAPDPSIPVPPPPTYLGLPPTVFHVLGLFGSAAVIGLAVFGGTRAVRPTPSDG